MDFQDLEGVEGLRFSWNAWPTTRLEASQCAVPFGIVCQPAQNIPDLPELPYGPVLCCACQAVLNPFCSADFTTNAWACCICQSVNRFPKTYSDISETHLPAELFPTHNVVQYALPHHLPARPPAVVFVVDTAGTLDDVRNMSRSVIRAVSSLPDGVSVALITFGEMVRFHMLLGSSVIPSTILVTGDVPVSANKSGDLIAHFSKALGFRTSPSKATNASAEKALQQQNGAVKRYDIEQYQPEQGWDASSLLVPVEKCRSCLIRVLQSLIPDAHSPNHQLRPKRVTGAAIAAAFALLERSVPNGNPGRIVALLSGPCTAGAGLVVERDFSDQLRSHGDLHSSKALHFRSATKYYSALGNRMVDRGFALDAFGCSADQVGLAELRPAVESTGGTMLLDDDPDSDVFAASLAKVFKVNEKGHLDTCFDGVLEVRTSSGVRVAGALGPCCSLKRKGGMGPCHWTSDGAKVGETDTWAWRLPCLTPSSAVSVIFEVASLSTDDILPDSTLFIQICATFLDSAGARKLRVCTVGRRWKLLSEAGPGSLSFDSSGLESGGAQEEAAASLFDVVTGFDHQTAAALVAKIAVAKMELQGPDSVIRWLDQMLLRFGAKFGSHSMNVAPSFLLSSNFHLFPSFVYHLRRSPFLQIFNCSPDESAFRRVALMREGVSNSLLMVQPTLLSYTLSSPPQYVPLDLTMVRADSILLYDSFFELVVHHGSTIAQWRKLGYHEDGSHANFRFLLEEPMEAAKSLAKERWLEPKLIICQQNDSLSRFLTYRLSPAAVQLSNNEDSRMSYITTDDVSLQSFVSHFQNLIVRT